MEIITASVSNLFAICLAFLAIALTLIGIYLELRAQKRHGSQENSSELLAVDPPPVPFNSQIFWRSVGLNNKVSQGCQGDPCDEQILRSSAR